MATPARAETLVVGGVNMPVPNFFPAISSVRNRLRPLDHLQVIRAIQYPQFLISAHDIYYAPASERRAIDRVLRDAMRSGQIVILDSGNYEAFWRERMNWWSAKRLARVLKTSPFHLAFAFDKLDPTGSQRRIVKEVEHAVMREQKVARYGTVVPIVHARRQWLPAVTGDVVSRLAPVLIAVPERELGDGLFERAAMVVRIRRRLDRVAHKLGYYCHLHLLGTGDPISILVYAVCGADCFDGLEWCHTTIDYPTARLHHFTQWELFAGQSEMDLRRLPYPAQVMIHNLRFYSQWLDQIRWAIRATQWAQLLEKYLPKEGVNRVKHLVGYGS